MSVKCHKKVICIVITCIKVLFCRVYLFQCTILNSVFVILFQNGLKWLDHKANGFLSNPLQSMSQAISIYLPRNKWHTRNPTKKISFVHLCILISHCGAITRYITEIIIGLYVVKNICPYLSTKTYIEIDE